MTELTQLKHLQESLDVIGQNLERLVHHFIGVERNSTTSHRDRQRDAFVPGETIHFWCVRAEKNPRCWGPFNTRDEAWLWLHKQVKETIIFQDKEEGTIHFRNHGHFTVEPLYTKQALAA